jgi:hypothetical protein
MKINRAIIEHYAAALVVSAVSTWRLGHHDFKTLVWTPVVAVLGPVAVSAYNHMKTVANNK